MTERRFWVDADGAVMVTNLGGGVGTFRRMTKFKLWLWKLRGHQFGEMLTATQAGISAEEAEAYLDNLDSSHKKLLLSNQELAVVRRVLDEWELIPGSGRLTEEEDDLLWRVIDRIKELD